MRLLHNIDIYEKLLIRYRLNIKHTKDFYSNDDLVEKEEWLLELKDGRKKLHKLYKTYMKKKVVV